MGLFDKEIVVEANSKPKPNNKPNNIKTESLNGYDSIREKLDGNNILTVKKSLS